MATSTISLPAVTFNILPAQQKVGNYPERVLIIGQMLVAGTATPGALTTDVGNLNEWDDLFGKASHVSSMIRAFRKYNQITPLDVVAYNELPGGVVATATLPFLGTATAGGTIHVIVASEIEGAYDIPVAVGDTASVIAAAVTAAITANTKSQFTAIATLGSVALTARAKGNFIMGATLAVKNLPAGITCTVGAVAAGAGAPVLTGLIDLLEGRRFQGIVYPGQWGLATIDGLMDPRLNVTNDILDGVAFAGIADTYANLSTLAITTNNPLVVVFGDNLVTRTNWKGAAHPEHPDTVVARIAAIRALRRTDGANIAPYTNAGPRDAFGGMHVNSLPLFNTPLLDVGLVAQTDGFTRIQIAALGALCIACYGNNIANNTTILGQVVTTYLTDAAGNQNTSFKYIEYVDTISAIREYYFNNARAKFAQTRLTDGGLRPGYAMANKASIEAYMCGLYHDLSLLPLAREGEENFKFFKDNLVVAIDLANGRVDIDMMMPIVVQLREILGNIRITFNTDGSL